MGCEIYDEMMEDKLNDLALITMSRSSEEGQHGFNMVKWVVAVILAVIWLCIWGRAIWKHSTERPKGSEFTETAPLLSTDRDFAIDNNPLLQLECSRHCTTLSLSQESWEFQRRER